MNKNKLGKDATKRQKEDPNKESRLISHPDVGQPVPRTEASLEVKLAKKRPRTKRSKKSLDGLYDVLAPGSSVIKTNEHTSVIKEPGKRDVTIRNSNLAKFGTKAEREYSTSTQNDNPISELTPNTLISNPKIETANISHSLFVWNRSTEQSLSKLNNFQRIATKFNNVYMMSQSNSDDETLMTVKQSTPSRVRFAEEGPSTAQAAPATPITPTTDTTATSPSVDDLYLDSFNFALSKIFSSSLMASLTTKDAILKEIRDCILTDNEDRCKQISPYIHSFWKDLHVKNGCVCIDDRIALPHAIKDAYVDAIHATHPGTWGMTDMATHAWWPYVHRDIATKTVKMQPLCQDW